MAACSTELWKIKEFQQELIDAVQYNLVSLYKHCS